jgi:hypothetical protein
MKSESKIFEDAELEAIHRRHEGNISDPTGAFARARKKLLEIKTWTTPGGRKLLHSLLKQKRGTKIDIPAKPNDEKSFEEFRQEVGY